MREFSKVSPRIHNSDRWRQLGRDYAAKCVYHYLVTCPHGNSIGCFVLKDGYATDDLDMEIEVYRKAMDRLSEVGLIAFDAVSKTVFIDKWLDHNAPTNPKHALGMFGMFPRSGATALFQRRFVEFCELLTRKRMTTEPAIRNAIASLREVYGEPIDRVSPPETETRPRLDRERDQTETRETSRPLATLTGGGLAPEGQGSPDKPHHNPKAPPDPVDLYRQIEAMEQGKPPDSGGPASRLLQTSLMRRSA